MTFALAVRQNTPEWLEARRSLITATDIPVLLGLSPYACEADVADEKRGAMGAPATLRMRVGLAVQDLIGEAYTETTGKALRRFHTLVVHPEMAWAGASPDFRVVGERRLVEGKWTTSRTRFADGLPQDVEAQVQWQLGVTGYGNADVAVLTGEELLTFPVDFDPTLFANLVTVAEDFRRRLAGGGPFSRDEARVRRDHPFDDGSEMAADDELEAAARALMDARAAIDGWEATEKALKTAITNRMGDAAYLRGNGWHATWKRTKDRQETNWQALADGFLRQLPDEEREALIGLHSGVRPGFRPFRLVADKEDQG